MRCCLRPFTDEIQSPTVYHILCAGTNLNRRDFKFTGTVESKNNIFEKIQFLLILHEIFSKTNKFTSLYAKLIKKKTWSLIHGLGRLLD